jgi:hypothetical protein
VLKMRVFIGSSGEQRRLVEFLTSFMLERYAGKLTPVPWTVPWTGGRFTLENLSRFVDETDASVLFWTADDKTWYRDVQRHEPRDNLVFEAGLFIAAHGKERTQLMVPSYPANDARASVAVPSDVTGLTWNQYQWVDGPAEATGLPLAAGRVCDYLCTLRPRPRTATALSNLRRLDNVEQVTTFVGQWSTIHAEGICQLAEESSAQQIDLVSAYRVGDIRRKLDGFKLREGAQLRACFANMWDDELLKAYQRKYHDRDSGYIRKALEESIQGLVGPCEVKVTSANDIVVSGVATAAKARIEIRLTSQRTTYGYYRIDNIAFVVPLDMKRSQNPAPLAWVIDNETAPRAFQHYVGEFDQMFQESLLIYPR